MFDLPLTKTLPALTLAFGLMASAAAAAELVVGMQQEPTSLDPTADATASIDSMMTQNVFESLTTVAENGEVQPNLATSWDVSEDGLTYTFHLAEGVMFHDGSALDADDVVFSFDRAMGEESVNPSKDRQRRIAGQHVHHGENHKRHGQQGQHETKRASEKEIGHGVRS